MSWRSQVTTTQQDLEAGSSRSNLGRRSRSRSPSEPHNTGSSSGRRRNGQRPDKFRAVTNPSQQKFDEERGKRRSIEEELETEHAKSHALEQQKHQVEQGYLQIAEQLKNLQSSLANPADPQADTTTGVYRDLSEENRGLRELLNTLQRESMSLQDEFNNLHTRFEEQREESEIDNALAEDGVNTTVNTLSSERDEAIRAWNALQTEYSQLQKNSVEIKNQATGMALDLQKCKETLKKMEEERAQANDTRSELEKLRTERDEAIRERDERESEVRTLRRKGKHSKPKPKPKPTSSSPNEDTTIGDADDEGDGDQDIPSLITQSVQQAMSEAVKVMTAELLKAQTSSSSQNSSSSPGSSPTPSSGRSSTTPKRKRHERPSKPGTPASEKKLAQAIFTSMGRDEESSFRSILRSTFLERTKMDKLSKFQSYEPVDDETAKNPLQNRKGGLRYRLYFGDTWRTSLWNKHVLEDMAKDVQAELKEAGESEMAPERVVACLWISVTQAQNSWKTTQIRVHGSGERLETSQEATSRARCQVYTLSHMRKQNKRRHDKFDSRTTALQEILKDKSLGEVERIKWKAVQTINKGLGADGQSSEDTDRDDVDLPRIVTVPRYRRRIVSNLMGDLDSEMKKRAQKANTAVHARRIRRRSEKVSDRPPEAVPRNLPECCYHRRYLRHLDPLAKEELGAKKSDIPYLNGLTQDSDSEKESTGSSGELSATSAYYV
ncbi:hypothetical protein PQX77_003024 [Marasmius sp. AFHP31]|nr:hypothetical protein PQX77_003024 [Marasmius sp. AFHP31]